MISRKASRLIAELYMVEFAPLQTQAMSQFGPQKANWSELYTFLYDLDYDPAFLEWLEKQMKSLTPLKDFVMRIHTGESINQVTINFTAEAKKKASQELLRLLARDI